MEDLFSGSLKELVCDCAEWSFWENYCTFVELVLEGPRIKDLESNNWTLRVTFWGLRFGQGVKKHSGEDSCSLFPVNSGTSSELLSYNAFFLWQLYQFFSHKYDKLGVTWVGVLQPRVDIN